MGKTDEKDPKRTGPNRKGVKVPQLGGHRSSRTPNAIPDYQHFCFALKCLLFLHKNFYFFYTNFLHQNLNNT